MRPHDQRQRPLAPDVGAEAERHGADQRGGAHVRECTRRRGPTRGAGGGVQAELVAGGCKREEPGAQHRDGIAGDAPGGSAGGDGQHHRARRGCERDGHWSGRCGPDPHRDVPQPDGRQRREAQSTLHRVGRDSEHSALRGRRGGAVVALELDADVSCARAEVRTGQHEHFARHAAVARGACKCVAGGVAGAGRGPGRAGAPEGVQLRGWACEVDRQAIRGGPSRNRQPDLKTPPGECAVCLQCTQQPLARHGLRVATRRLCRCTGAQECHGVGPEPVRLEMPPRHQQAVAGPAALGTAPFEGL